MNNKTLKKMKKKITQKITHIDALFEISGFLKSIYGRELNLEKGSAGRNWLEKHNPNHPLLKSKDAPRG